MNDPKTRWRRVALRFRRAIKGEPEPSKTHHPGVVLTIELGPYQTILKANSDELYHLARYIHGPLVDELGPPDWFRSWDPSDGHMVLKHPSGAFRVRVQPVDLPNDPGVDQG